MSAPLSGESDTSLAVVTFHTHSIAPASDALSPTENVPDAKDAQIEALQRTHASALATLQEQLAQALHAREEAEKVTERTVSLLNGCMLVLSDQQAQNTILSNSCTAYETQQTIHQAQKTKCDMQINKLLSSINAFTEELENAKAKNITQKAQIKRLKQSTHDLLQALGTEQQLSSHRLTQINSLSERLRVLQINYSYAISSHMQGAQ